MFLYFKHRNFISSLTSSVMKHNLKWITLIKNCATHKKLTTLRLWSSYYDPTYIVCDVIAGPIREDFVKDVVIVAHMKSRISKKKKKIMYRNIS